MRSSRLALQLAEEDSQIAAEQQAAVTFGGSVFDDIGAEKPTPRVEVYRSLWQRFIGKHCASCGGPPPGWVQRQVQTPYRVKRLILWMVNLLPRIVEFLGVVFSPPCSTEKYTERMSICRSCPDAVLQLRLKHGMVKEKLYCGRCSCPKWAMSELGTKNMYTGHLCPVGRHPGSDPNRVYQLYLRGQAQGESATENSAGTLEGGNSDG